LLPAFRVHFLAYRVTSLAVRQYGRLYPSDSLASCYIYCLDQTYTRYTNLVTTNLHVCFRPH